MRPQINLYDRCWCVEVSLRRAEGRGGGGGGISGGGKRFAI